VSRVSRGTPAGDAYLDLKHWPSEPVGQPRNCCSSTCSKGSWRASFELHARVLVDAVAGELGA
jgi:hypothetical protein